MQAYIERADCSAVKTHLKCLHDALNKYFQ